MRRLLLPLAGFAAVLVVGLAAAAAPAPVPAKVERAIMAKFPKSQRFYFPSSLPAAYHYDRWEVVKTRGQSANDAFRIEFAPLGKTFAHELQANGRWATWVGYRLKRPCKQQYYGGWRHSVLNQRDIYYVQSAGNGKGAQTASVCGAGYAADLTLNRLPLSAAALKKLVAFSRVVTR